MATGAVGTQSVMRVFSLPLLERIAAVCVWVALGVWALTFVGLARYVLMARSSRYHVRLRRCPQQTGSAGPPERGATRRGRRLRKDASARKPRMRAARWRGTRCAPTA